MLVPCRIPTLLLPKIPGFLQDFPGALERFFQEVVAAQQYLNVKTTAVTKYRMWQYNRRTYRETCHKLNESIRLAT